MRVFISQKMNGLTKKEIQTKRMEVLNKFNEWKYLNIKATDIVNPIEKCFYTRTCEPTRLDYLGEAIKDLAKADIVIFTLDSAEAKGCSVEYECCRMYADIFRWRIYKETADGFKQIRYRRSE